MRFRFFSVLLLCSLILTPRARAHMLDGVTKIYVVDFTGDIPKKWGPTLASMASARLLEALKTRKIQVFTWLNLKQQLKVEQRKEMLSCSEDKGCIDEVISGFGIAVKLFGHITKPGKDKYSVSLTLMKHAKPMNKLARAVNTTESGLLGVVPVLALQVVGVASVTNPQNRATGTGQVEKGVEMDRGESIVNQITDETGFLFIKTVPAKASILINNKPMGHAPLQLDQMVGHYVIVAELGRMYHPARQEVDLTTDGARVTLTLPPAFGRVNITSTPGNAKVRIDGEQTGMTPLNIARKPSGKYALRIIKDYYFDYTGDLMVKDGKTTRLDLTLKQNSGSLTVDSSPPGAAVAINNRVTGRHTPVTFDKLQPGIHNLKLTLMGYGDTTKQVRVENRKHASVSLTLPPKLGILAVMSSAKGKPCEGELVIDGKKVGQTPWKGKVLAIIHKVTVKYNGYAATRTVTVEHNRKKNLLMKLHSSGFVLIPSGCFDMGSPDSEAGREDDEGPVHRVCITHGFMMSATEVTQGQWKSLMGNNPSDFSSCGANCPVETVSW